MFTCRSTLLFNPLNAELNPICHLLALLVDHHILHISRIRVNSLLWQIKYQALYSYFLIVCTDQLQVMIYIHVCTDQWQVMIYIHVSVLTSDRSWFMFMCVLTSDRSWLIFMCLYWPMTGHDLYSCDCTDQWQVMIYIHVSVLTSDRSWFMFICLYWPVTGHD